MRNFIEVNLRTVAVQWPLQALSLQLFIQKMERRSETSKNDENETEDELTETGELTEGGGDGLSLRGRLS